MSSYFLNLDNNKIMISSFNLPQTSFTTVGSASRNFEGKRITRLSAMVSGGDWRVRLMNYARRSERFSKGAIRVQANGREYSLNFSDVFITNVRDGYGNSFEIELDFNDFKMVWN
jgi:hypothetical protein